MNREELLGLRESYVNAEPLRGKKKANKILKKWFDDYIKHETKYLDASNINSEVLNELKVLFKEKGFKIKIEGGGVVFDGYPNKTWIYIENV